VCWISARRLHSASAPHWATSSGADCAVSCALAVGCHSHWVCAPLPTTCCSHFLHGCKINASNQLDGQPCAGCSAADSQTEANGNLAVVDRELLAAACGGLSGSLKPYQVSTLSAPVSYVIATHTSALTLRVTLQLHKYTLHLTGAGGELAGTLDTAGHPRQHPCG
jgi:hypothetical protein